MTASAVARFDAAEARDPAGKWVKLGEDDTKETFSVPIADAEALADPQRLGRVRDTPATAELAKRIRAEGFHRKRALVVDTYNDGSKGLGDGYHRLAGAKAAGEKTIPINVYRNTPAGRAAANRQTAADEAARVMSGAARADLGAVTPKPPRRDPDVQPRSVVARLIRDINRTPALQRPEYYQRAREIAAASGAADLVPAGWGDVARAELTVALAERAGWDSGLHPRGVHGKWATKGGGVPFSSSGDVANYHGHLGVNRSDMPQLSGLVNGQYQPSSVMVPKFMAAMRAKGIHVQERHMPVTELAPTQTTGDVHAIRGIADSLKSGSMREPKRITVSSDGHVMDGHHNWAGLALANAEGHKGEMPVVQIGLPARELIKEMRAFAQEQGIASRKTGEHANPVMVAKQRARQAASRFSPQEARDPHGRWYHGSNRVYEPGHIIDPSQPHAKQYRGSADDHAYLTSDMATAQRYADMASGRNPILGKRPGMGGDPHVYEVAPAGELEPDYRPGLYRTRHPMRVIREVTPSAVSSRARTTAAGTVDLPEGDWVGDGPRTVQDGPGVPPGLTWSTAETALRAGLDDGGLIVRAGRWRHEWIPLDAVAAHAKFHGRVPGGWSPGDVRHRRGGGPGAGVAAKTHVPSRRPAVPQPAAAAAQGAPGFGRDTTRVLGHEAHGSYGQPKAQATAAIVDRAMQATTAKQWDRAHNLLAEADAAEAHAGVPDGQGSRSVIGSARLHLLRAHAGETGAAATSHGMALAHAKRTHLTESTGLRPHLLSPVNARGMDPAKRQQAERALGNGNLGEASRLLAAEVARLGASTIRGDRMDGAFLAKLQADIDKAMAKQKTIHPPLVKVGGNTDGSVNTIDHLGREFRVALDAGTGTVSVSHGGKTATGHAPDVAGATNVARKLAGKLTGVRGAAKLPEPIRRASWDEAAHPRIPGGKGGGEFAKVAAGIEATAAKVDTATGGMRGPRVKARLTAAAGALRAGDREKALAHLDHAHSDATGSTARQRVPHVMVAGQGSAGKVIAAHKTAVQQAREPKRPAAAAPGGWSPAAAKLRPASVGDDSVAKYMTPDGKFTPERQALHREIVARALASVTPTGSPVATFLGGGTASGKSTALKGHLAGNEATIDPDALKGELPDYTAMVASGDPRAAAYAHEESSYLAKVIQAEAIARRMSFLLDGTGDSSVAKMVGKVAAARQAGHKVSAKYVTVDTDTAIARAEARAQKTGRMVPPAVIAETHASVSNVFSHLIANDLLDEAELWDTNGPKAVLVGSKPPGGQWRVHDNPAWTRFLDKAHGQGEVARSDGLLLDDELDAVDLDALIAEAVEAEEELSRFNPFHAPAGSAAGGQFSTASSSGAAGPGGHGGPVKDTHAAQRRHLKQEAHQLREQAHRLAMEVRQLVSQLRQAATAAKSARALARKSTAAAKAARTKHRAAHTAKAHTHRKTARKHTQSAVSIRAKIAGLRTKIHALRQRADHLDRQAGNL